MLAYNHMCVLYECAYVRAYVSACMRAFVCAVCVLCMYVCVCEQACVCVRASVSFKFLIHLSTARMHPPFTHASFTPSRLIFTSKFMHLGTHACPARTTLSWPKMCICRYNHGQLCVSTCVYVYQCVYSSPTCSHTSCVCAPRALWQGVQPNWGKLVRTTHTRTQIAHTHHTHTTHTHKRTLVRMLASTYNTHTCHTHTNTIIHRRTKTRRHKHVRTQTHTRANTHTHIHVETRTQTRAHTDTQHTHTSAHTHSHAHAHMHIHTLARTHVHKNTHKRVDHSPLVCKHVCVTSEHQRARGLRVVQPG